MVPYERAHRMKKLFLGLIAILALGLLFPTQIFASGTLVISSQVRGSECCDPGSMEAIQSQLDALKRLNLPATFSLRYDALADSKVINAVSSDQFEKAAFLEITPSLAHDAGVAYRGPIERWYKASNAYLVGYTPADRLKLIDTYMRRYKEVYGSYPQSTLAWMIDAPSLEYLSKNYGISTHQLTREQWGTDSYTLYGGPVNVPYYPSSQWAMIPAQSRQSASPVLIVRQTITDPLFTYGDAQSSTTSQPNDYLFGKRDFRYFQSLVDGALASTVPNGFGVLGLETSMGMNFQTEFVRQLEYVDTLRNRGDIQVKPLQAVPSLFPADKIIGRLSAYSRQSQDLDQQAVWINAIGYRARLINDHQRVLLTDLRVYSDSLSDPYTSTSSSTLNAYWTVPFLFDGSRFRVQSTRPASKSLSSVLSRLQTSTRESSDFALIENDFAGNATGLLLPRSQRHSLFKLTHTPEAITVDYESESGVVSIQFLPSTFTLQYSGQEKIESTFRDDSLDALAKEHTLELLSTRSGQLTTYRPVLAANASIQTLIAQFPRLFSPESVGGVIDLAHTTATVVNPHALLGQSPIRIVLRLRDKNGTPTLATLAPTVILPDLSVETTSHVPESAQGEYYIDLNARSVGASSIEIVVDSQTLDLGRVTVSPHCFHAMKECLRHPRFLGQFVLSKFDEIMRRLRSL